MRAMHIRRSTIPPGMRSVPDDIRRDESDQELPSLGARLVRALDPRDELRKRREDGAHHEPERDCACSMAARVLVV